jgi:hypothetical protein
MTVQDQLYNQAQAYLYVFVDPNANVTAEILQKRAAQIQALNAITSESHNTLTTAQILQILRNGIYAKYKKSPELILQIIYDNAKRILSAKKINGNSEGLTFDGESNQWYDGSGNAYLLDTSGNIIQKNGTDILPGSVTTIENPTNIENISVSASTTKSTFWDDVKSVIDWIVNLLQQLGITNSSINKTNFPTSTDWSTLDTSTSSAGIGNYLPYIVAAGIVITLITNKEKSKKSIKK